MHRPPRGWRVELTRARHAGAAIPPYETVAALFDAASSTAPVGTFLEAVEAAGLHEFVNDHNGTIFVPSDEAWEKLLTAIKATKADLLGDKALMTSLMQFHVTYALVLGMTGFAGREPLMTAFKGQPLAVDSKAGAVLIAGLINTASITSLLGIVGSDAVRCAAAAAGCGCWQIALLRQARRTPQPQPHAAQPHLPPPCPPLLPQALRTAIYQIDSVLVPDLDGSAAKAKSAAASSPSPSPGAAAGRSPSPAPGDKATTQSGVITAPSTIKLPKPTGPSGNTAANATAADPAAGDATAITQPGGSEPEGAVATPSRTPVVNLTSRIAAANPDYLNGTTSTAVVAAAAAAAAPPAASPNMAVLIAVPVVAGILLGAVVGVGIVWWQRSAARREFVAAAAAVSSPSAGTAAASGPKLAELHSAAVAI
jgi:hypothetical protein